MTVVKIFFPKNIFYRKTDCEIFGEIQISEKSISYFIISDTNRDELRHLGCVGAEGKNVNKDVSMIFSYDSTGSTIHLAKLNIKTAARTVPNIFLYDAKKIMQMYCPEEKECQLIQDPDDVEMLYKLLVSSYGPPRKPHQRPPVLSMLFTLVIEAVHRIFSLLEHRPLSFLFNRMALCEHYNHWKIYKSSRKRFANILLDKILGLVVMIVLLFFIAKPGDNLIQIFNFVIYQLRHLLGSLKGSPIGLKLNVHLNNFFLDCFTYHIDLWATFLDLIEPIVRQLFVPMAMLGLMGFSFQLAMLADLISLVGLHAHSFYIYTAVLYKIEIKGLQVLWKVVLGKRRNPLKNRVESHEYMNRQLYLATIFFASLVFLLPTILVYYTVFTTLRLVIFLATLLLKTLQRKIVEFPLEPMIKWSVGRFYEIECLHLQHIKISRQAHLMDTSVFEVKIKSSPLPRVLACQKGLLKEAKRDENFSLRSILTKVLKGTI